ncbi:MAG: ribosome biogenesis GTP-binding protein YihA/YsxC [Phaeodactylibacter sp.]|uniref:ribosome biogenesis GTP-binding protein YihA/YsxC n=1 Tax=Phaeodactylibacter sp. TaxID=1940289 RepID=UPI0032ED227D
MEVKQSAFAGSYAKETQCPRDGKPEYAFIGRSNVGKSSLVNMLCKRKGIARISRTPGKTQLLNYFLINEEWYLVDLPGYGYAKISKKKRQEWQRMIRTYLKTRYTLQSAFVLIDSNVPPQEIDLEFMNELGAEQIPFSIVYTKADRLKVHELEENLEKIRAAILEHWEELPPEFISSSNTGRGRAELLAYIHQVNQQYFEHHDDL